jgi:hypothetical protein
MIILSTDEAHMRTGGLAEQINAPAFEEKSGRSFLVSKGRKNSIMTPFAFPVPSKEYSIIVGEVRERVNRSSRQDCCLVRP